MNPYITTIKGHQFYLTHPELSVVDPEEIAYALSNLCRFTGHVKKFYSVAQHCVLVSRHVPHGYSLEGLLHDAAEAYTGDINHPLKVLLGDAFSDIEGRIERQIAQKFHAVWPWPKVVREADYRSYLTEIRDVASARDPVVFSDEYGRGDSEPWEDAIVPWDPKLARGMWMRRFEELT